MEKTGTQLDIIRIYLTENWGSFLVVSALSTLASILEIFGIVAFVPLLAKEADIPLPDFITNSLVNFSTLQLLCLISVLFLLKSFVLTGVSYARSLIFSNYEKQFVDAFLESTIQTRWRYFVTKPVGEIMNTVQKECPAAALIYSHITTLFSSGMQLAILTISSLYISWQASVLGVVGGVLVIGIFNFLPKILKSRGKIYQQSNKVTSGLLHDFFANIKPLKSMNKDFDLFRQIEPRLDSEVVIRRNLSFMKGAIGVMMEPIIVIFICLILFFALETLKMSFAESFVLIVIFYKLMSGWKVFSQSIMSIAEYEGYFWAVKEEIEKTKREKEVMTGELEYVFSDHITFRAVDFEYIEGQKILNQLSFDIPHNQLTAIVGASGSGKTTIVDLLCKMHEPTGGRIMIDGVDLHDIKTQFWRSQIGYVPQEFFMLNNTLRHNVTLGDDRFSDEEILSAMRKAGLSMLLTELDEGLNTMVGEKGVRFSGGQRQRISIARALLRRPKLLILDEATTALDPETEKAICQELRGLTQDTTVIAISHQSAILSVADNVINLS